jgi:hypothetical protein
VAILLGGGEIAGGGGGGGEPSPPPPQPCRDFEKPPNATIVCATMYPPGCKTLDCAVDCTPCKEPGDQVCHPDCICTATCSHDHGVVPRPNQRQSVQITGSAQAITASAPNRWHFTVDKDHQTLTSASSAGGMGFEQGKEVLIYTEGILNGSTTPCSCSGVYTVTEISEGEITVEDGPDTECNVHEANCMIGVHDESNPDLYQQLCTDTGWSPAYIDASLACVDINECITQRKNNEPLCQNNGQCKAMGVGTPDNSYSCSCTDGWKGDNCETEINPCDPDPCNGHGTCTQDGYGFSCTCSTNPDTNQSWYGSTCSASQDLCSTLQPPLGPCGGPDAGTCDNVDPAANEGKGYICTCFGGLDASTDCRGSPGDQWAHPSNHPDAPAGETADEGPGFAVRINTANHSSNTLVFRPGHTIGVRFPALQLLSSSGDNLAEVYSAKLRFAMRAPLTGNTSVTIAIRADMKPDASLFTRTAGDVSNRTNQAPPCHGSIPQPDDCIPTVTWHVSPRGAGRLDTCSPRSTCRGDIADLLNNLIHRGLHEGSAVVFTLTYMQARGQPITVNSAGISLISASVDYSTPLTPSPPSCDMSAHIMNVPHSVQPVQCYTDSNKTNPVNPSISNGGTVPVGAYCQVHCCAGFAPTTGTGEFWCRPDGTFEQQDDDGQWSPDFNCNRPRDPCKDNRDLCGAHGHCHPPRAGQCAAAPTCTCLGDYSGTRCEHSHNDCVDAAGHPKCRNGGSCLDGDNNFTCTCLHNGFSGRTCEDDVDECQPNPCGGAAGHPGTCTESSIDATIPPGDYRCRCDAPHGWHGGLSTPCSQRQCPTPDPCQNGGKCIPGASSTDYTCQCRPGYENNPHGPQNCGVDIDECAEPSPCGANGHCNESGTNAVNLVPIPPGKYRCTCHQGWIGDQDPANDWYQACDRHVTSPCDGGNPCSHGSTCLVNQTSLRGFSCHCVQGSGMGGPNCNTSSPCNSGGTPVCHHGACDDLSRNPDFIDDASHHATDGYNCICQPGYTGPTCTRLTINTGCGAPHACPDPHKPTCVPGTRGQAHYCEGPCATGPGGTDPCGPGGTCGYVDPVARPLRRRCRCTSGYTGPTCATASHANPCNGPQGTQLCRSRGDHGATCTPNPGADNTTSCDCSPGYVWRAGQSSGCHRCPDGQHPKPNSGSTLCVRCPVGRYTKTPGSGSCNGTCSIGQEANDAKTGCQRCGTNQSHPEYYAYNHPTTPVGTCMKCLAGTQATRNRHSCSPCASWQHSTTARPTCQKCPDGKHAPDQITCDFCTGNKHGTGGRCDQACLPGHQPNAQHTGCTLCAGNSSRSPTGMFSTDGAHCHACGHGKRANGNRTMCLETQ